MLKRFDIFGTYPKFYHEGKGIYQTYVGSLLSLLLLGSTVLASFYYGKEIYQKKNPQTIYSEEYTQSPDKYVLKKNKFSVALSLQNFAYSDLYPNVHFIDESVYKLIIRNTISFQEIDQETGETISGYENVDMPLRRCTLDDFQVEGTEDFFSKLTYINELYCIDNFDDQNIQIEGDFGQEKFSRLQFKFQECRNSTESDQEQNCRSQEEIDQILQSSYMAIYYTDEVIQPKNYTHPFQHIGRDAFYAVSNKQRQQIDYNFRNTYMESNTGLIWDNIETQNTIIKSQENTQTFTSLDSQGTFFLLTFRFEKIKQNRYFRSYLNVATVLAQVGGIVKILFLLFWFISYFFSSRDLDIKVLSKIFTFKYEHPLNQKDNKQDKDSQKNSKQKDIEKTKKKQEGENQNEDSKLRQFLNSLKNKIQINTIKSFFHLKMLDEAEKEQKELFQIAHYKLKNELDFIRIIQKIQEIDKIKALLLNEDQIQLFEEISKTVISKKDKIEHYQRVQNYKDMAFDNNNKNNSDQKDNNKKKLTVKQIKEIEQEIHFKKSFLSYKKIDKKKQQTETDQKVLQLMDQKVLNKFQEINKEEKYVKQIESHFIEASQNKNNFNNNNLSIDSSQRKLQQQQLPQNNSNINFEGNSQQYPKLGFLLKEETLDLDEINQNQKQKNEVKDQQFINYNQENSTRNSLSQNRQDLVNFSRVKRNTQESLKNQSINHVSNTNNDQNIRKDIDNTNNFSSSTLIQNQNIKSKQLLNNLSEIQLQKNPYMQSFIGDDTNDINFQ